MRIPSVQGEGGPSRFPPLAGNRAITEEQVDPKTAQGILRRASSDITTDIYTHWQDEAKRKAVERYEFRWLGENPDSESQVKN